MKKFSLLGVVVLAVFWAGGSVYGKNAVNKLLPAPAPAPVAKPVSAEGENEHLMLSSPLDYQVFQRRTVHEGVVVVIGKCKDECDLVEARLEGKDISGKALPDKWSQGAYDATTCQFTLELKTPAGGWYVLKVRSMKDGKEVGAINVEHVGMGEVFVGAGQSNSTNCGGLGSKSPLDGQTKTTSGIVSTFDGKSWRIANDPQPGTHDAKSYHYGSFWPAFGDAMAARFKVPIGVAVTGHGGTSIKQWAKGAKDGLFDWTLTRMNQLGKNGFRAVLWHQGESDYGMTAEVYADGLEKIIKDFRSSAGWEMPWFVAHASYIPRKPVIETNSRGGQKILWEKKVALEGPDTDKMVGDLRDRGGIGIHFSKKGLKAHGKAWAEKVGSWLDGQLKQGK